MSHWHHTYKQQLPKGGKGVLPGGDLSESADLVVQTQRIVLTRAISAEALGRRGGIAVGIAYAVWHDLIPLS
jgi:hypothetical protein